MNRRTGNFFKKVLAGVCVFALAVTGIGLGQLADVKHMDTLQAATYSHVKATQADVRVSNYYNKKGVQGTEITTGPYAESLTDMSVNHSMLNIDLAQIINTDGTGTPYEYNGHTYYFNEQEGSFMKVWQERVREYREQGVVMSFCLVLGWSDNPQIQKLMYNPVPGKVYYALNSTNPEAREHIAAILHYMADRFGYSDTFVQYWRVGNEVNVSHAFNFTDADSNSNTMQEVLVSLAVASYDLLAEALKDENPYAKAYVSITHDWNSNNDGMGVPSRDFLDAFASRVSDKDWNVDFHAYPPQMHEQVWTKASAAYLRHDVDTKFICAPNLEVLTNYIKDNYGTNHRVVLSEQSFDSRYGEEEQAAMIAYTYYAAAANDMIDAVIFTTWQDTNSVYHDYYDMGFITYEGDKKKSFDVFKYMNTDQASTYVDPYLNKLSTWTGRTISSWSDDILYQTPPTSAVLTYASLYLPADQQADGMVYIGMTTTPTYQTTDLEYKWEAFNYTTMETVQLSGWTMNNEWLKWFPTHNATYNIKCTVRVAGNPSSVMTDSMDVLVNSKNLPDSVNTGIFAINDDGYAFYRDEQGNITCTDKNGNPVINNFVCDGTYTYYFQADGTAMKDRLTYHPDGIHVIYFDSNGHEVFSNFAHVSRSITNEPVNDYCFFDVHGYMYVDVLTWNKAGDKLLYANAYGRIEQAGWFQFSESVQWANGASCDGIAGGYGYGQSDCTLLRDTFTYDWLGRPCYLQGNGVALY